jgi:hypothetical protein
MIAKWYIVFFLSLISPLCSASNDVILKEDQNMHTNTLSNTINMFIALPLNSASLDFDCGPGGLGRFVTQPGKTLKFDVPPDEFVSCKVVWGHLEAIFQANFDQSGKVILPDFWVIKTDGFFHTFDHIHYVRKATWGPIPII